MYTVKALTSYYRKGLNSLWCARRDSNARPLAPEAHELDCYHLLWNAIYFINYDSYKK